MAENGILDYQGMNQAIYRGATSNIVVDTQSMSIEIGAGNTSHTSNLHFECNHDANVASIKLNSNVTTEFSRSKKLIKYPRVAIASGQSGLGNGYTQDGYTIQVSSEWGGIHMASNVFNNIQAYQPTDSAWLSANSPDTYTPSTGMATSADTFQNVNGSWVGLTLPEKIKLSSVHLYNRAVTSSIRPARKGIVWGSDGGSTWYRLKDFTNGSVDGALNVITVESGILYDQFRVQITEMHNDPQKDAVAIGELEFYGVPEYDPDAHGTDVVVKSVPNVPNTDWLEVYYDAKGLTPGAVGSSISGLGGTTISATKLGNPQVSNDAFVFDGSGDAIVSGATSLIGKPQLSYSVWFKTNSISSGYGSNSIVQIGHSADDKSLGFRIKGTGDTKPGNYRFYVWGGATNESVDTDIKAEIGMWTHATVVYDGLNSKLYIDGKFAVENTNTTTDLDLASGAKVALGNYIDSNGALYSGGEVRDYDGSIANVRLFNRALTTDEIYQLYAYQKEEFGHSTNNMTLKAGRLGIGTSEPRGVLDVRGDMYGGCPVFFTAYAGNNGTVTGSSAGTVIVFNTTTVNKGGAYDTSNGKCTFPISGYYEVFFRGGTAGTADFHAKIYRNGNAPGSGGWINHLPRIWDAADSTYRNGGTIQFFDYFEAGEYIEVRLTNFTVFNADNYNSFSVKYLSN